MRVFRYRQIIIGGSSETERRVISTMTAEQMSSLTGVSVRTLQFYDEVGLLKPAQMIEAGYRMYDENAVTELRQILFFRELDLTLEEIKTVMASPLYDKEDALGKQQELIRIKEDRLNALLELLDRFIKGEGTLDLKESGMSGYFQALIDYKRTHIEEIVRQLGSMRSFDEMISELKANEGHTTQVAVRQYSSVEKFTETTEENLQYFLENGPGFIQEEADEAVDKTDMPARKLTVDLSEEVGSDEVQKIAGELVLLINESNRGMDMSSSHWSFMVNNYMTNPALQEIADRKYGKGVPEFMGRALKVYFGMERTVDGESDGWSKRQRAWLYRIIQNIRGS